MKWKQYKTKPHRRRQWHPTPGLLPGESHGRRSLVGCSPWGRWESDTTERLHFHFSLSCIGEGNGNPLQCSCLENLRDRGAWWAAVYGVAQSRTQLPRLSSSSSSRPLWDYIFWGKDYTLNSEFYFKILFISTFQKYGEKQIYISIIEKKISSITVTQVFLPSLWEIYLALARRTGRERNLFLMCMPDTAEENHPTSFVYHVLSK